MTHDASGAGVALREPPPGPRSSGRRRIDPTREDPPSPPAPPAGRFRRFGPTRALPWLDAAALLLVLVWLGDPAATALVAVAGAAAAHAAAGLYRPQLTRSVLDELPVLLGGIAAGVVAGTALGTTLGPAGTGLSRLAHVLGLIATATTATATAHLVAYRLERRSRARDASCPTVIVGSAGVGGELGRTLMAEPQYGLRLVGYLDESPAAARRGLSAPLVGSCRDLLLAVESREVRCVLIAFGASRSADLVELLRACDRRRCQVLFVPRFYELHQATRRTDVVGGIPLVRLRPDARHRPGWRLKRPLDVVLAAVGLFLAAPVLAACALALRREGGPGVLFRQQRVGLDDRLFTLLKLRTLRPASEWESRTRWSVADDPRLGPAGRLLRAASLDEVPQLANVLRGEMSMVGPRPERPFFVEEFSARIPGYAARHRVPAGLTGWAAVNGLRGDTSIAIRAHFDNSYIENWSLWLDIKILIRTLGAVLVRSGG